MQHLPTMEQALPSLSDGWHACSRRCQLALDLTARGTGFTHPPLHSPGDCIVVGGFVSLCLSICCFREKNLSRVFATFHLVLADRRATARTTTFVEPCSIQTKKTIRLQLVPLRRLIFGVKFICWKCSEHLDRDGCERIGLHFCFAFSDWLLLPFCFRSHLPWKIFVFAHAVSFANHVKSIVVTQFFSSWRFCPRWEFLFLFRSCTSIHWS